MCAEVSIPRGLDILMSGVLQTPTGPRATARKGVWPRVGRGPAQRYPAATSGSVKRAWRSATSDPAKGGGGTIDDDGRASPLYAAPAMDAALRAIVRRTAVTLLTMRPRVIIGDL